MNKVLVTGATGFVAMNIIKQLLENGYAVKATVRNMDKVNSVLDAINLENPAIEFVELDLTVDTGWHAALADIDYVLSVAAPVSFGNNEDILDVASKGIMNILTAANGTNVKKVVMTSNFGAVGFSNLDSKTITTEDMWTDENQTGLSIYEKSKLLAEKKAWDYINNVDPTYQFATVNAVAIWGPQLNAHTTGSFNLINGKAPMLPDMPLNITDVRDVAALHIAVMNSTEANNKRFVCSSPGSMTMNEIYKYIDENYPEYTAHKNTKIIPKDLIPKDNQEGQLLLNINRNISTENSQKYLNWTAKYTNEDVINATIESLLKHQR